MIGIVYDMAEEIGGVVDETVASPGEVARISSGSNGPFCAHRPRVFGCG